jgi:hypothetical protein
MQENDDVAAERSYICELHDEVQSETACADVAEESVDPVLIFLCYLPNVLLKVMINLFLFCRVCFRFPLLSMILGECNDDLADWRCS